jgi:signal transduction histidine kinase
MNHELRTPLNHIIGYSGLLKREISNPKSQHRLERMEQSAQQLLRLVENLLDTAKLESNQIHIAGADFELHPLLEKLQAQVLHSAPAKPKAMVLELDLCADVPRRLHGDGYRVWQVLSELIDNAVKFSSQGPIILRISHTSCSANLVNLRFDVQDHGIGVALELQASLFEFFLQGDSSSTRQYGGVGLGLGLCHRMVNLMAGDMGFSSELGGGSCFWVELPFGVAAETEADAIDIRSRAVHTIGRELLTLLQNDHEYAGSYFKSKIHQISELLGDFFFLFEDSLRDGDFALAADILTAKLGDIS